MSVRAITFEMATAASVSIPLECILALYQYRNVILLLCKPGMEERNTIRDAMWHVESETCIRYILIS